VTRAKAQERRERLLRLLDTRPWRRVTQRQLNWALHVSQACVSRDLAVLAICPTCRRALEPTQT
jgi:DeoR/GlpR family transcriptional regulator of sugar metabolism